MSGTELHLAVAHVPVVGSVFVLLIFVGAAWRQERVLWQAGMIGAVALALVASVAMSSGPVAHDALRSWLDPEGTQLTRLHEATGQLATAALALLAVLSLHGWLVLGPRGPRARWVVVSLLVTSLIASAAGIWAGTVGGRIRHVELRSSATNTVSPGARGFAESPLDSIEAEGAGSP